MKNLTFYIKETENDNILGWKEIKVIEKVLSRTIHHSGPVPNSGQYTNPEKTSMSVPEYTLDCIADGEFVQIEFDEFIDQLMAGNYSLQKD